MSTDLKSMLVDIANKQKEEMEQQKRRFDILKSEIEQVGAVSKETRATVDGFQQEIEKTSWQSKGNKKDIKTVIDLLSEVKDLQVEHGGQTKQIQLTLPGFAKELNEHKDNIISLNKSINKVKKLLKIA